MSKKHMILMLLCCLVGMGSAAAILFFGIPINRVFSGLLILFCPLSHLLMMGFMKHSHDEGSSTQPENGGHCSVQPKTEQQVQQ